MQISETVSASALTSKQPTSFWIINGIYLTSHSTKMWHKVSLMWGALQKRNLQREGAKIVQILLAFLTREAGTSASEQ